jgi:methylenetetrahydrofolate dehydrogenase (NADP+)/methenyltetrahydrofolate cyclohydrolase
MTAEIISGKEIAKQISEELKQEVNTLKYEHQLVPGLATVLLGDDPASQVYVNSKVKKCESLGIRSSRYDLPTETNEATLLELVARLNKDFQVHGILVQLPLPEHIDESKVLMAIDPRKDVDGFHPVNVGKLMIGEPDFLPCTPHGIQQLLVRSGVEIEGADVVIVGRSNIVGKPVANILLQKQPGANATVTMCHTRTRDMAAHTRRADILIVAAGKPKQGYYAGAWWCRPDDHSNAHDKYYKGGQTIRRIGTGIATHYQGGNYGIQDRRKEGARPGESEGAGSDL